MKKNIKELKVRILENNFYIRLDTNSKRMSMTVNGVFIAELRFSYDEQKDIELQMKEAGLNHLVFIRWLKLERGIEQNNLQGREKKIADALNEGTGELVDKYVFMNFQEMREGFIKENPMDAERLDYFEINRLMMHRMQLNITCIELGDNPFDIHYAYKKNEVFGIYG